MAYGYTAARRADLARRWRAMKVLRKQDQIDREARAIIAHKGLYQQAERATGVPWWMIGVIDAREGGVSRLGTRHLHCGDPLSNYTVHVPSGRPAVGHGPPFTWLESAIDALKLKGFDKIKNWTIERVLHSLEPYNGLGYFNGPRDPQGRKYPPMPSPYIWSCTNQYDPPFGPGGKYVADHVFDPHTVDSQVGCAPLIAKIAELDRTVGITSETAAPSPTHPADTAKKAAGPVVVTTATASAAAAAHQQGVPAWAIMLGIAAVISIALAVWAWRQSRES